MALPNFPTTAIDLVQAADRDGLHELVGDHWPEAFYEALGATLQYALNLRRASSKGTASITGTSTRAFTLEEPRGWKAGTPVLVVADAAPTNRMLGFLTSDEASSTITVQMSWAQGGGIFSSWTITTNVHFRDPAPSIPNAVADGGTEETTEAAVRARFGVPRQRSIVSVASAPPGFPATGDLHIVGDAPTGAFAGQENNWAERISPPGWTFETPLPGDLSFDLETRQQYLYTGASLAQGVWADSFWRNQTPKSKGVLTLGNSDDGRTFTEDEVFATPNLVGSLHEGQITIDLPRADLDHRMNGHKIRVLLINAQPVVVQVASGQTINAASSITLLSPFDFIEVVSYGATHWHLLASRVGGA